MFQDKLTIKTPEHIVNLEHISPFSSVSIVTFEQLNAGWAATVHKWSFILK